MLGEGREWVWRFDRFFVLLLGFVEEERCCMYVGGR